MTRRARRTHGPAFKAKVALAELAPQALSGCWALAGIKWLGQNGEMTPEPATYPGYLV